MMLAPPVPQEQWTDASARLALLGVDLLAARARLKLTASGQARAIGISTSTLSAAVSASGNPSRATIFACWRWLIRVTV